MEVFWKDFRGIRVAEPLEGGVGPVLSVFAHDHEVLRFDCLGERGHFHAVFARIEPTTYSFTSRPANHYTIQSDL